jgi:hypothetical protein
MTGRDQRLKQVVEDPAEAVEIRRSALKSMSAPSVPWLESLVANERFPARLRGDAEELVQSRREGISLTRSEARKPARTVQIGYQGAVWTDYRGRSVSGQPEPWEAIETEVDSLNIDQANQVISGWIGRVLLDGGLPLESVMRDVARRFEPAEAVTRYKALVAKYETLHFLSLPEDEQMKIALTRAASR